MLKVINYTLTQFILHSLSITGGILISYLTIPPAIVMAVEGLSFLYGCGLLYRWLKSKLLPTFIQIPLLTVNTVVMSTTAAISLAQSIGYLTGLIATAPFQHIQFAAIPFALLIEHFIVLVLEKINALRKAHNEASEPDLERGRGSVGQENEQKHQ